MQNKKNVDLSHQKLMLVQPFLGNHSYFVRCGISKLPFLLTFMYTVLSTWTTMKIQILYRLNEDEATI